jgi:Ca2+/Na+ antiporter
VASYQIINTCFYKYLIRSKSRGDLHTPKQEHGEGHCSTSLEGREASILLPSSMRFIYVSNVHTRTLRRPQPTCFVFHKLEFVIMYLSLKNLESWPTPNYTDPETRGPGVIYINSILYPLVLAVVGIRTYTRVFISRSFGLDDTFILLAMVPLASSLDLLLLILRLVPNNSLRGYDASCSAAGWMESA